MVCRPPYSQLRRTAWGCAPPGESKPYSCYAAMDELRASPSREYRIRRKQAFAAAPDARRVSCSGSITYRAA